MTTAPNERLSTEEVAKEFKIKATTLRSWRRYRRYDKRYPRYHKLFRMVYYIRSEIEEDLKGIVI